MGDRSPEGEADLGAAGGQQVAAGLEAGAEGVVVRVRQCEGFGDGVLEGAGGDVRNCFAVRAAATSSGEPVTQTTPRSYTYRGLLRGPLVLGSVALCLESTHGEPLAELERQVADMEGVSVSHLLHLFNDVGHRR